MYRWPLQIFPVHRHDSVCSIEVEWWLRHVQPIGVRAHITTQAHRWAASMMHIHDLVLSLCVNVGTDPGQARVGDVVTPEPMAPSGTRCTTTGKNWAERDVDSVSRPARKLRRHLNNMFALIPCCRASFDTDTPGSHAAAAKRCLNSTG
jgi:hypothetical protein